MKKLITTSVLAVFCSLSFGQNVTDLNFTGCLAKTTFFQFSLGASNNTIATAGGGWVSAIAAPTVDVANITDLALTITNGSTLVTAQSTTGAPISTTTTPTNYTGSEQPLSGWAFSPTNYTTIYAGNAAGDRYRGVNIFIHKLIPAPLPIVIPTTYPGVQPGYAQCTEIVNAGTNPQLHSNGQAIYFAFTSAADIVKFQTEVAGTIDAVKEPNDTSKIYVEKSADLITWSNMQTIPLLTPQNPTIKTYYSIPVNDPAARYVRLRIAGLYNGRSSRKINIRSMAVLTKPEITWNQDFSALKTTDEGITLDASSTVSSLSTPAGSDITYTSGDANVVTLAGNLLFITGAGTTTITAKQAANANYAAANDVVKTVVVTDPTGVKYVKEDAKLVYATSMGIVSKMEGKLNIYSVTGMLVKSTNVNRNQLIAMPAGVYVVCAAVNGMNFAQKVVL
jgi:hypothetical protein